MTPPGFLPDGGTALWGKRIALPGHVLITEASLLWPSVVALEQSRCVVPIEMLGYCFTFNVPLTRAALQLHFASCPVIALCNFRACPLQRSSLTHERSRDVYCDLQPPSAPAIPPG